MFGSQILIRNFSTTNANNLRVAVIGQSQFGQEVYKGLFVFRWQYLRLGTTYLKDKHAFFCE